MVTAELLKRLANSLTRALPSLRTICRIWVRRSSAIIPSSGRGEAESSTLRRGTVSSGEFDVSRPLRMPNGIFLSLYCGFATVYPVVRPFEPKPIRRGKAAQAKELVDNSQLNDTIIAHIDSAVD